MPTHLRALVVIMGLAVAMLWFARRYVVEKAIAPDDFKRRAGMWITLTLLMCFTYNYWLYALISVPLLVIFGGRDSNRFCFFLFLILAIPPFPAEVPGFGVFNSLLTMDHLRWMALAVLLPAYLSLRHQPGVEGFGRTPADVFVLAYMLLWLILQIPETTATNLFRILVTLITDIFLPYYVASRALRSVRDYRDALASFVIGLLIIAPMLVFENIRTWLLYSQIESVLGLPPWGMGGYLARDGGILRAIATAGHPIVAGYHMAVGLALAAFLYASIEKKRMWWALMLVLGCGLVAAMSRGPWVGTAAMTIVLLATGPRVASKLMQAGLLSLLIIPALLMTEQGQKIIDYLPFVGTVETRNVEGRQHLFEVAMRVIMNYPFFGSLDFMSNPDIEALRGNDGIVDLVNSYVGVALSTGFVGLALFVAPFAVVILGILKVLFTIDKNSDLHLLGRALLAAVVAILVTIGTVSSICAVSVVYLSVMGMGAGYLRLVAATQAQGSAMPGPYRQNLPPRGPRMAQPRRQH